MPGAATCTAIRQLTYGTLCTYMQYSNRHTVNMHGRHAYVEKHHRCGDLYGDKAIDTFNACAVSDQKCVPQRQDEGLYPVPGDCALDEGFDINMFQGRWYITAGQNPLFDIFDCQVRMCDCRR